MSAQTKPDADLSCCVKPLVGHYYTGAYIRLCNCDGPMISVYTDGRAEYAHCDQCHHTWNLADIPEVPV
jgi:hypothetical protein